MMMSTLDTLDIDLGGGITSNPNVLFGNNQPTTSMNSDEYARCNRCGYGGCDVRFVGCGCTMHA
jgi:hypothetical protein